MSMEVQMTEKLVTISSVAHELGWTISKVRYHLNKRPDIPDVRIAMGKHQVRIRRQADVPKLVQSEVELPHRER